MMDDEDLILDIIIELKQYKSKERRNSFMEDNVLNGILMVLYSLLYFNPEYIETAAIENGLIDEIFNKSLF